MKPQNEDKKNWDEMIEKEAKAFKGCCACMEDFKEAVSWAEANAQHMPKVKALIEALEKNKLEWEAVNPNGHKHMVAWQMTRDALEALSEEKI